MASPQMVVNIIGNTKALIQSLEAGRGAIEAYGPTVATMRDTWARHSAVIIEKAALVTAGMKGISASTLTARDSAGNLKTLEAGIAQLQKAGQPIPAQMQALATELRNVGDSATKAAGPTEGLGARITGLVGASAAAVAATRQLVSVGTEWLSASSAQEDATVRLDTALRAQGTFTPQLAAQYHELAASFQNTTKFSDELVVEMQALLIQVGSVMPKDMKAALTASTDLAAGLRIDLQTATQLVGKAFGGETGTLKRYGIVIDETALKTQGVSAVLDAIASKMGGQATTQAKTLTGQMASLGNVVDDVQETFGGFLARVLSPAIDLFTSLPAPVRTGAIAVTLLGTAATALAIAVAGVAAAVALALPLLGMSAAGAGAVALGGLGTAAGVATAAFLPLSAAIAAVWAAWKIGNTEIVKNTISQWALSSENLTAKLSRLVLGIEKMTPEQAKAATTATAAGVAAATLAKSVEAVAVQTQRVVPPLIASEAAIKKAEAATKVLNREAAAFRQTMNFVGEELLKHEGALLAFARTSDTASVSLRALALQASSVPAAIQSMNASMDASFLIVEHGVDALARSTEATREANEELLRMGMILPNLGIASQRVSEELTEASGEWVDNIDELAKSFARLAQVTGDSFRGVVQWIGTLTASLDLISQGQKTMGAGWQQLTSESGSVAAGLSDIAAGAVTVAAAFMQATSAGTTLQRTLSGAAAGAKAGSAFGPWGTAIGAGVGALVGYFRGRNAELDAARAAADDFRVSLAGLLTDVQRLEAQTAVAQGANAAWAVSAITVRDAYLAAGFTAAEALDAVDRLWKAEKQGGDAVARVIDEIRAKTTALAPVTRAAGDAFDRAATQGVVGFQHVQDTIRRLTTDAILSGSDSLIMAMYELENQMNVAAMSGVQDFAFMATAIQAMKDQIAQGITIPIGFEQGSVPGAPSGDVGGSIGASGGGGSVAATIRDFLARNPLDNARISSALGIDQATVTSLGFRSGTPNLDYMSFPSGGGIFPLHNTEAVIPKGSGHQLAAEIAAAMPAASFLSAVQEVRQELVLQRRTTERRERALPHLLATMIADAMATTPRR